MNESSHVADGSFAPILAYQRHIRFAPNSDTLVDMPGGPFRAISDFCSVGAVSCVRLADHFGISNELGALSKAMVSA